jgi:hypothetical protein
MNIWRIKRPSSAFVVAIIALFVALGGTAGAVVNAAVPLAKRALVADNAKKLGGQTASQLALKAAQAPGPASTASGLVTVKSVPYSLGGDGESDVAATCDAGQKAIAGGFDNPSGFVLGLDSRPSPDGSGWRVYVLAGASGGSGNVYAVCLR